MSKDLAKALLVAAANEIDNIADPSPTIFDVPMSSMRVSGALVEYMNVASYSGDEWKNGQTKVYVVTCVDGIAVACTCPDWTLRKCNETMWKDPEPCKHMNKDRVGE